MPVEARVDHARLHDAAHLVRVRARARATVRARVRARFRARVRARVRVSNTDGSVLVVLG